MANLKSVSKVAGDLLDLTASATCPVALRASVAAVIHSLIDCDSVGIHTSTPGHLFQSTQTGFSREPFTHNGWRYLLEHPREATAIAATRGFIRVSELLDASTMDRLACYREFFGLNGLNRAVSRCWLVNEHLFIVNACRRGADFRPREIHMLESIFPQLAVSVRMCEVLARETDAKLSSMCDGYRLSPRQREIAQLIIRGMRNTEIGVLTGLKPNTVRNYIADLYRRTHVSNRSELTFLLTTQTWTADPTAPRAHEFLKYMRTLANRTRACVE